MSIYDEEFFAGKTVTRSGSSDVNVTKTYNSQTKGSKRHEIPNWERGQNPGFEGLSCEEGAPRLIKSDPEIDC